MAHHPEIVWDYAGASCRGRPRVQHPWIGGGCWNFSSASRPMVLEVGCESGFEELDGILPHCRCQYYYRCWIRYYKLSLRTVHGVDFEMVLLVECLSVVEVVLYFAENRVVPERARRFGGRERACRRMGYQLLQRLPPECLTTVEGETHGLVCWVPGLGGFVVDCKDGSHWDGKGCQWTHWLGFAYDDLVGVPE